ncbi:MAG: hypothetical protein LQ337_004575 [Flavoplaca oasis]|nr:MAG: hypothetical protein LQ337_004575 [Flavoplaca oasis]
MVLDTVERSEKKVPAVWTTDGPVGVEDGGLDEEDEDNEEIAVRIGVEDDVELDVDEPIDVDNAGNEVEERDTDEVVIMEEVDELAKEEEDANSVLVVGEEVGEDVNNTEDAGGMGTEEPDAVEEDGIAVVEILCTL